MKKLKFLAVIMAALFAGSVFAQKSDQEEKEKKDEQKVQPGQNTKEKSKKPPVDVVITPSRFEKPASEVARTMEVKDKKEIKDEGQKTVSDVLANSPGVFVTRTGGYGGETGIYLRGAKTEQLLIMVDGIEVNDPMAMGRSTQAEILTLPGVERVEVLAGPASALYGSDAEAGVINIITTRPKLGQGASLSFEGGSYETYQETADLYIGHPKYFADFTIGNFSTRGISTVPAQFGGVTRNGFQDFTTALKGGARPFNWLEISAVGRYIDAQADLDTVNMTTGLPEDDPNYKLKSKAYLGAVRANIFTGDVRQKLEYQYSSHVRDYDDKPDALHPLTALNGDYKSALSKLSWQGEFTPDNANKFMVGFEYRDESGSSDIKGASDYGPYEDIFPVKHLFTKSAFALWDYHEKKYGFMAGGRADDSSQFGNNTAGDFSAYMQPFEWGPKIKAGIGTGFKAPSLFQLYGNMGGFLVGNPSLQPENSLSKEIGLDQELLDKRVKLGVTYFDVKYTNLIIWDNASYSYSNIEEAKTPGWEAYLKLKPIENLDLYATYSFVNARDAKTDEKLIRRWGEKYTFGLGYQPVKQVRLDLWGIHRGPTTDEIFAMGQDQIVPLKAYTVLNGAVNWKILNGLSVNFRAENIFNEKYYEVYGYSTMPQTFYAGVTYDFKSKKGV